MSRWLAFARKVWNRLPVDGAAIVDCGPPAMRRLRKASSRSRWQRVPRYARPVLIPLARVLWLFACPLKSLLAMPGAPPRDILTACRIGWTRGRDPLETLTSLAMARSSKKARAMAIDGLTDPQSSELWQLLSHPGEVRLAGDKIAMANALTSIGIPVPQIYAEVQPGSKVDLNQPPWTQHHKLFLKPRQGSSARGALAVECHQGSFTVNSRALGAMEFHALLTRFSARYPLLVQPFLEPSPDTRDITPQAPAWLRIFTCRGAPGSPPAVFSAMLKILPAERTAETRLERLLRCPIAPDTGALLAGSIMNRPTERFDAVPWNLAPLTGRTLADWPAAAAMSIQGADLLPRSPLVGWDVLLTAQGPIMLEANLGLSWFGSELWYFETATPSPLRELALSWLETRGL